MSNEYIHYTPSNQTGNVRCLNGSAHAERTNDMRFVTCPLCLKPTTNVEFWFENGQLRNFKKSFFGINNLRHG